MHHRLHPVPEAQLGEDARDMGLHRRPAQNGSAAPGAALDRALTAYGEDETPTTQASAQPAPSSAEGADVDRYCELVEVPDAIEDDVPVLLDGTRARATTGEDPDQAASSAAGDRIVAFEEEHCP